MTRRTAWVGCGRGRGDDHLEGEAGAHAPNAGDGNDLLCGRTGADRLDGEGTDDLLEGGRGKDRLAGGPGDDDTLNGDIDADRSYGGAGGDRLTAVDGRRDTVDCGLGRGAAIADREVACEDAKRATRGSRPREFLLLDLTPPNESLDSPLPGWVWKTRRVVRV
jgi:hypothetical protein